jgi:tRNA A-37 threonylcarbamoyl transferase component Bud32
MPDRPAERLIADRYALAAPIGQGGMGVVWRARDTVLGREVAIKEVRLPPTIPESERSSIRARVLREARAAARLNHPNAVTLYDVINQQGHAFIVMELISAPTLAQVVASEGPLDPRRAARIGAGVAGALAAAHAAGIVHRDVKPANVMVLNDGARLTDFGIARAKGDPKLTSTGLIIGSPAYMAPEQATGKAAGPEVDLWGLGATLYYAVEGRAPFDRDGSIATLAAVVNDQPRPAVRAGELAPVLAELLSKDPEHRPSADALRERLERIAGAEPAAEGAGRPTDTERFPEVHPDGSDGTAGEAGAAGAAGAAAAAAEEQTATAEEQTATADGEMAPAGGEDAATVPRVPPVPLGQVAAGVPLELTRPSPSGPGRQRPGQVRPDQPARPARGPKSPPHEHPTAVAPDAEKVSLFTPAAEQAAADAERRAGPTARSTTTSTGAVAGGRAPDRRLLIAAVAVLALVAASVAIATVLRNDNGGSARAGGATATTRANATATTAEPTGTTGTTTSSRAPTTTGPSGGAIPPGWTKVISQSGAYSFAYPPGWRVSSRSDTLNTVQVSGPGGRLFKTQSSNRPSDPMQAWTEQERSFRTRPGYQKIRLEPGTYKGLRAAVWEFTQLVGGQRVHKLDITFKSADGRWGYAVLLQSPERSWSSTQALSSQFERSFTPTG